VKNPAFCLGVALLLSGCGSIQGTLQEMSLGPNVVRVDTSAGGAGQTGPRTPQTMRAAARATLAAGYTHFKFSDASSAAAPLGARPDAGCAWGACVDGGRQVSQVGLTVTMFHANEPGAAGALDAKQVLDQYKG
jgi:hypothetical protein